MKKKSKLTSSILTVSKINSVFTISRRKKRQYELTIWWLCFQFCYHGQLQLQKGLLGFLGWGQAGTRFSLEVLLLQVIKELAYSYCAKYYLFQNSSTCQDYDHLENKQGTDGEGRQYSSFPFLKIFSDHILKSLYSHWSLRLYIHLYSQNSDLGRVPMSVYRRF